MCAVSCDTVSAMSDVIEMVPRRAGLASVVAGNVRAECSRRNWQQGDLATALGLSRSTISRRWSGAQRLEELAATIRGADVVLS